MDRRPHLFVSALTLTLVFSGCSDNTTKYTTADTGVDGVDDASPEMDQEEEDLPQPPSFLPFCEEIPEITAYSDAGCAFALKLPTAHAYGDRGFTLHLMNPGKSKGASVALGEFGEEFQYQVPPEGELTLRLSDQQEGPLQTQDWSAPVSWLISNRPLLVTLFTAEPESAAQVTTMDATRLLPYRRLGQQYQILSRPTRQEEGGLETPSFAVLMGAHPTNDTRHQWSAGVATRASDTEAFLAPDTVHDLVLGDSPLLLQSADREISLSRARVESLDGPSMVFAGTECGRVPQEADFCDFMITQMAPVEAAGNTFVLHKTHARGEEEDHWQLQALEDDTQITIFDTGDNEETVMLARRGDEHVLRSRKGFVVRADKPLQVAQYTAGQSETGVFPAIGDPSMTQVAPLRAYQRGHWLPSFGDGEHEVWGMIVYPAGEQVMINGELASSEQDKTLPENWRVLEVELGGEATSVQASAPVGAQVVGYGRNTAWQYTSGLVP